MIFPADTLPVPPRFTGNAVRIVLSFLVVAGLLAIAYFAIAVRVMAQRSAARTGANVVLADSGGPAAVDDVLVPWPRFPGCMATAPGSMMINGVRTISEEWEITASAVEVIDFLKEQMCARGWADCTEESYGLRPELRSVGGARDGLQNENYVNAYSRTIDSCLAMRDSKRFMQATLEPGTAKGRIRVSLFSAETSSFDKFAGNLALSLGGVGTDGSRATTAEFNERSGGLTYDTRLVNSELDPDAAVGGMMEQLTADRWKTVLLCGPGGDSEGGRWALFRKGSEYAYLTVAAEEDGNGSSAILTKVTGGAATSGSGAGLQ